MPFQTMNLMAVLALTVAYQSGAAGQSVCYSDLGCLTLHSSWYNILHRPLNVLPLDRSVVNTHFVLRTRQAPTKDVLISARYLASISSSTFKASRPTKLIVHGFLNDGTENWHTSIAAALLAYGDFNVIIVRWGGGARPPYFQAAANTRLVGLEIANLVNKLVTKFRAKAADFHLIGHSLGAHVVGYAGKRIAGLGRITGLDPAGPYFQWMPSLVRLDSSDAQLVDIIHTNGVNSIFDGGFGLIQPIGHVDFYPNGGQRQPGCSLASVSPTNMTSNAMDSFLYVTVSCSHMRAIPLFIDSLTQSSQSIGYECASYAAFKQGKCGSCGASSCAPFAMAADQFPTRSRTGVKLYLDTGSSSPYRRYHYRISVNLARPPEARALVNGAVQVSMTGASGSISSRGVTTSDDGAILSHGRQYPFLLVEPSNVGRIFSVTLSWRFISTLANLVSYCIWCNRNLYVASVQVSELDNYPESARLANTFKLCPSGGSYASIASGSSFTFTRVC